MWIGAWVTLAAAKEFPGDGLTPEEAASRALAVRNNMEASANGGGIFTRPPVVAGAHVMDTGVISFRKVDRLPSTSGQLCMGI